MTFLFYSLLDSAMYIYSLGDFDLIILEKVWFRYFAEFTKIFG